MNENEAIERWPPERIDYYPTYDKASLSIILSLAREALARRQQPTIAEALDELENEWRKRPFKNLTILEEIRAKYCEPKPEPEAPTLKTCVDELGRIVFHILPPELQRDMERLLDQLTEVK